MVEINPKRVDATNENINAQIKLILINEQRVINIFLNYTMSTNVNIYVIYLLPSSLLIR